MLPSCVIRDKKFGCRKKMACDLSVLFMILEACCRVKVIFVAMLLKKISIFSYISNIESTKF